MSSAKLCPPVSTDDPGAGLVGAAAPGVVPGGPVYQLPQWVVDPIDELIRGAHKPAPTPTPTPVPTPGPHALPFPAAIVEGVNDYRATKRLPALAFDAGLTGV